jgi:4-hydroxy-tetrahydrodipicolinate reductase
MIRVAVIGAAGRMGRAVCAAVAEDPELELALAIVRADAEVPADLAGSAPIGDRLDALAGAGIEIAVDFTRPDVVMDNIRFLLEHGIHAVVGTTGISSSDLEEIRGLCARTGANAVVAPNFAVGAVLMQRLAELVAPHMPAVEIIELHHDRKLDAPSGTAAATARRIAAARGQDWRGPGGETMPGARGADEDGIRIHSVRLPGLVAHQEVIFGSLGQTLTIRHDSTDRTSFMPGVVLAVKAVGSTPGLTVGLEPLLGPAGA